MTKKRWLAIAKFLLLFLAILYLLSKLMGFNNLRDTMRLRGFYKEPQDSLDVVMIGASEVHTGIAPGQLWKSYGFTSYDYSMGGMPATMLPYALREVQEHQNPRLIVIEVNGALPEEESYQTDPARWRIFLDNIPWSGNKTEALRRWVPEEELPSYYLPFLKYHENWRTPLKCAKGVFNQLELAVQGETYLKGMQTNSTPNHMMHHGKRRKGKDSGKASPMTEADLLDVQSEDRTEELSPLAEQALRELLDKLKEDGVDNVLFVRFPHVYSKEGGDNLRRANRAGEIIGEYGFPFLNLEGMREEIGLDWKDDFYNGGHMNVLGQRKFTDYFGRYLQEHYDLTGLPHSDETIARWNRAAQETEEFQNYAAELTRKDTPIVLYEDWRLRLWQKGRAK